MGWKAAIQGASAKNGGWHFRSIDHCGHRVFEKRIGRTTDESSWGDRNERSRLRWRRLLDRPQEEI
jgi:hypothetical protein